MGFLLNHRILRDLRQAGFADAEWRAVRDTPAMWAQLTQFYADGGRIERVEADFAGATGAPGLIRFFCPPAPAACAHSTYGSLAHELGHALFFPEQWRAVDSFDNAEAYARSRELGEARAWLNQYTLSRARADGVEESGHVQWIENDQDFGRTAVDLFARIAERQAAGWPEARILDELATLNANMFPCGMGEGNHKTYGQCNRWDWLRARPGGHAGLQAFLKHLPRAPTPSEQKLITKFNLFDPAAAPPPDALAHLADALAAGNDPDDLDTLFSVAQRCLPHAEPGVLACRRDAAPADGDAVAAA